LLQQHDNIFKLFQNLHARTYYNRFGLVNVFARKVGAAADAEKVTGQVVFYGVNDDNLKHLPAYSTVAA
jgi:hypothetical protein